MTRDEYLTELSNRAVKQADTASEVARKIAFAAGAGCWIFRGENFEFPPLIIYAFLTLCIFFVLDLIHYTSSYRRSSRLFLAAREERALLPKDLEETGTRDRLVLIRFFYGKLALLIPIYLFIVLELVRQMGLTTT